MLGQALHVLSYLNSSSKPCDINATIIFFFFFFTDEVAEAQKG